MKRSLRISALILALSMCFAFAAGCDGDQGGTSSAASSDKVSSSSPLDSIESVGAPSSETSSETSSEASSETSSDTTVIPTPSVPDNETIELIAKGAEFTCNVLTTEEFNTFVADNPTWMNADFDRAGWQTANAPLGDRVNGTSPIGWTGNGADPHGLLAVTTFEVEDLAALEGKEYSMDIFYDNTIYMYLNGNLIFSHDANNADQETATGIDWVDDYTVIPFTEDIGQYIVEGTNTLSVSLLDVWGGRELDLALTAS